MIAGIPVDLKCSNASNASSQVWLLAAPRVPWQRRFLFCPFTLNGDRHLVSSASTLFCFDFCCFALLTSLNSQAPSRPLITPAAVSSAFVSNCSDHICYSSIKRKWFYCEADRSWDQQTNINTQGQLRHCANSAIKRSA